jgi:hypothetical protein
MLLMGLLPTSAAGPGGVEVVNATPALATHVDDAFDAFTAKGLPMPTVASITFDPDDPFCESHLGRYTFSTRAVLYCFDEETTLRSDALLHRREQRVLLHELAHAWTQQHTTAEQRRAFMALHGVERWNDGADQWHERGIEIAAETFVWALWDHDDPPRSLASKNRELLAEGFELLVGAPAGPWSRLAAAPGE